MIKHQKKLAVMDRYLGRLKDTPVLKGSLVRHVNIRIVIPALNEAHLWDTLHSIAQNENVDFAQVEVIIVLNSGEQHTDAIRALHRQQYERLKQATFPFAVDAVLLENIPTKTAGVGYARKTGMDAALARFRAQENTEGLIVCLDGDCLVAKNYLTTLLNWHCQESSMQAGHLFFEHPVDNSPASLPIVLYESHLRLMKNWLAWAGHPQAFHAVGSCLFVRAWAYASQSGMNTRQAGEDFYFIHKYSKIRALEEINSTTVYPSARLSDRVPFGTGASMQKVAQGITQCTYNPESYKILKTLCKAVPTFYTQEIPDSIFHGFKVEEMKQRIEEAKKHTSSLEQFTQRFFQFFDAFQIIKFLHHLRDQVHPDVDVHASYNAMCKEIPALSLHDNALGRLQALRQFERSGNSTISQSRTTSTNPVLKKSNL